MPGRPRAIRGLRRNSVTAGIAVPRDRTPGRLRWWPCSIRPSGQWHLPLILRPASMSEHAGQISLPGGGAEPGEAAQRAPCANCTRNWASIPHCVQMLGSLPPIYVYASNFLVRPFVALATERPAFQPGFPRSRRTAGIARAAFVGPTELRNTHDCARAAFVRAPCITFQGRHIWGATALILGELLNVILDRERDSLFARSCIPEGERPASARRFCPWSHLRTKSPPDHLR